MQSAGLMVHITVRSRLKHNFHTAISIMINFDSLPTDKDPIALIHKIDHVRRQHDSLMLVEMISKIGNEPAVIWTGNVIGFGQYEYAYKTGRKGFWPIISFTTNTQQITINVMQGLDKYEQELKKIGKVKTTGNSLILYKLTDINRFALEQFIKKVFEDTVKA